MERPAPLLSIRSCAKEAEQLRAALDALTQRVARLEAVARDGWALYQRHPWLLQVATARTVLGPGVVARYDAALGLLDGLGLSAVEVVRCVAAVESFARGAGAARRTTGRRPSCPSPWAALWSWQPAR